MSHHAIQPAGDSYRLREAYEIGGRTGEIVAGCAVVLIVSAILLLQRRAALGDLLAQVRGRAVEPRPGNEALVVKLAVAGVVLAIVGAVGAVIWMRQAIEGLDSAYP